MESGMNKITRLLPLVALLLALLAASPSSAFKFSPIEMTIEPSGRGSTRTFQITNVDEQPIAVELRIEARDMAVSGEDILEDAEDLFVVFPAQTIVMPGQSQSIRVQWLGEPNPDRELAFRLFAEQLPIDLDPNPADGARVRILVRYVASLYVAPRGASADLAVDSADRDAGAGGSAKLLVVIENNGSAHALLRNLTLSVTGRDATGADTTVALTPEQLDGMIGQNVLAGRRRAFRLPWPTALADGPVSITFDYVR